MKKDQHTVVSIMHYVRLLLRSAIFIVLLVLYILNRTRGGQPCSKTRPLAVKKMMGDFFDYQLFFIFAKNISQ